MRLQAGEKFVLRPIFGLIEFLDGRGQTLEAGRDQSEVGEQELKLQHFEVASWIQRTLRVGHRLVLEPANDMQERIGASKGRQVDQGGALAFGHAGNIDELDGGRRLLLGRKEPGQRLQPGIWNSGDSDPRVGFAGLGGERARQKGEECALADLRQSENSDFHGPSSLRRGSKFAVFAART